MSQTAEDLHTRTARLSEDVTDPLPGSRQIYQTWSRTHLRFGMREIEQTPSSVCFG